jgi:O-antigen/teichoic acid export membrane protein
MLRKTKLKRIIQSKFVKNTSIYTISDILNKMVPFVLLPVLTRYLTPEDYGIIAMFFVFTAILGIVMTLETNTAISVNYFKISRKKLKVYIANILLIIAIATSITFIFMLIFSSWFTQILAIPTEWLFIGIIVTLLQFITTINLVLWQSEHNPVPLGIYQISQTIVNLSLSLILIIGFKMGWEGRLIALATASILFGMMSFVFLFKRDYLEFKVNKKDIKDALKFGVPLLPHALSVWFRTGIDRVFLTSLVSASATGVYTVGFQIASVITILTTAFNKAYAPHLFEKLKKITESEKHKLVKYAYIYFFGLLLLATVLSLSAPFLIDIFLGKSFLSSKKYISWIAFGFAFYGMYSMVVNYVLYTKQTVYLSYVTFSVSLLHVVLSYVFISRYGALGAAQATTITSFLTFAGVWWLSHKLYPMPWFGKKGCDK